MEGRTKEMKAILVKNVTKAICESVNTAPENVRIILQEMSVENYSIAGELICEKK